MNKYRVTLKRPAMNPAIAFCCFALLFLSLDQVGRARTESQSPPTLRFALDSSQSKFIAHGLRGGLLWFKGHEHLIAVRRFTGVAEITAETVVPGSLELRIESDSLEETSEEFTEQQKGIINKELREIVLEPEKYPEIVFKSTDIEGKSTAPAQYDLKVGGNLTLHGITRRIVIPTKVSLTGNDLRAVGEFSIDRGDFKVKATSAFHGLVRVRDKVKFTFDIVGHRV